MNKERVRDSSDGWIVMLRCAKTKSKTSCRKGNCTMGRNCRKSTHSMFRHRFRGSPTIDSASMQTLHSRVYNTVVCASLLSSFGQVKESAAQVNIEEVIGLTNGIIAKTSISNTFHP